MFFGALRAPSLAGGSGHLRRRTHPPLARYKIRSSRPTTPSPPAASYENPCPAPQRPVEAPWRGRCASAAACRDPNLCATPYPRARSPPLPAVARHSAAAPGRTANRATQRAPPRRSSRHQPLQRYRRLPRTRRRRRWRHPTGRPTRAATHPVASSWQSSAGTLSPQHRRRRPRLLRVGAAASSYR